MPFFTGEYSDDIERGRPPLQFLYDQIAVDEENILLTGEKVLTKLMNEALQKKIDQKFVPGNEIQNEFKKISIDRNSDTPLGIAVQLGKGLHVDYIVVGVVWEYQERKGTKMSADEPASVSFSTFLVDVAAEKRIWRERYSKKQQSLSDNLLKASEFFKQGAKWLTAEELARHGVKKVLVTFPLQN